MSRPVLPRNPLSPPHVDVDAEMQSHPSEIHSHMEQMVQAMSTLVLQVNHTNQALAAMLDRQQRLFERPNSRVRPRSFAGLPTEDVPSWVDHFENVASYHNWSDIQKSQEIRTVFEGIAATWYIQQDDFVKIKLATLSLSTGTECRSAKFTQATLNQLRKCEQLQGESVAQFVVKFNQILLRD